MNADILLIDDDPGIQFSFGKYLEKAGYNVEGAANMRSARNKLLSRDFDIVLLDVKLPDGSGMELIEELREKNRRLAIIVITGHGDISLAVDAMKKGADNFLTKPVIMAELDVYLHKSLELIQLRRQQERRAAKHVQPFFGQNPLLKRMKKLAKIAAGNESGVLLYGETGTGKEVLARWIHRHSSRSDKPFVEVNCAGLKDELLTSELFGHARGAFTTAVKDRQGLIEAANGGILFLDEISSMNLNIQAQLLKVIEEKSFRRLGETRTRQSDFRLICATNKNLQEEVRRERFRDDLFFRINVFPIELPSLREIKDSLPELIQQILQGLNYDYPNLSLDVMEMLTSYDWPGNIREMKNVLERALILAEGGPLKSEDFTGLHTNPNISPAADIRELTSLERDYIKFVVDHFAGDTKKAADALGISRASLYRKLHKYQTGKQ